MRTVSDKNTLPQKLAAISFIMFSLGIIFLSAAKKDVLTEFMENSSRLSYELFYSVPKTEAPPAEEQTEADKNEITYHQYSLDEKNLFSGGTPVFPSSDNEDVYSDSPAPAPFSFPDGSGTADGEIIYEFFGRGNGENFIDLPEGGQVRNLSSLDADELISLSGKPLPFEIKGDGSPEVLIMHTHTTECYEEYEKRYYDINRPSRILDETQNMTAVGNVIAEEIVRCGIGVIHDTTVHDYPDYNGSYDRSRQTAENILKQYPSVKVILDIHRDAIERGDSRIAPVTEINGRKAAQVMIICGCDDRIPDFRKNFIFASALESEIESDNPTLTRPVLFDYRHYNQDLTTGSLLIEVGGHANTLSEALYSGELIGRSIGKLLKKETEK